MYICLIIKRRCDDATAPMKCISGNYASVDDLSCVPCPKGYKCPVDGLETPLLCNNGTYQNGTGNTECIPCPAGMSCENPGGNPVICSVGQYSIEGMSECLQCPAGFR